MSVVQSGFTISMPLAVSLAQGTSSGSLTVNDSYNYAVTYLSNFGESLTGLQSSLVAGSTGSIQVTIPAANNVNVTGINLYRTMGNGSTLYLVSRIVGNPFSINNYTDTTADSSLSVLAPLFNGASSSQVVQGNISFAQPVLMSTTSVTAASQSPYPVLTSNYSIIASTVSVSGVMLPYANSVGTKMSLFNDSSYVVTVYCFSNNFINGTNSYTLPASSSVDFLVSSQNNWSVVIPFINISTFTVQTGIVATASTYPILSNSYSVISSVPAAGDAVQLPSATEVGVRMVVSNYGSLALTVYPASGQYINDVLNDAVSISVNASTAFVSVSSGNWVIAL